MDPVATHVAAAAFKSLLKNGVFSELAGALEARRARKVEGAFRLLVESLVELEGLAEPEASQRLEHILLAGEPGTGDPHEALYQSFRSFAFTRTEAAWPYIARLTADYLVENAPIDSFFRRMAWLLERCEDHDVEVLRVAARTTAEKLSRGVSFPNALVTWSCTPGAVDMHVEVINASDGVLISTQSAYGTEDSRPDGVRALLIESRLAQARGARKVSFKVGSDRTIERLAHRFGT